MRFAVEFNKQDHGFTVRPLMHFACADRHITLHATQVGINDMSDLTDEEFRSTRKGLRTDGPWPPKQQQG